VLLPEEELLAANGLQGMMRPVLHQVAGPAAAGLLVAAAFPELALLVTAAAGTGAAVCVAGLPVIRVRREPAAVPAHGLRAVAADLREGFGYRVRTPWLLASLLFASLMLLAMIGPLEVLAPFAIRDRAGGGPMGHALVLTAFGVGRGARLAAGLLAPAAAPLPDGDAPAVGVGCLPLSYSGYGGDRPAPLFRGRRGREQGMHIAATRLGAGPPLVLLHGLGGSWRSWQPVLPGLAADRRVVAVDLPGFAGDSPPLPRPTFAALTDAVEKWLVDQELAQAPLVGSSLGARMVLELARRGVGRCGVALDPGGFWTDREARVFRGSIATSMALVRRIRPALPALLGNPAGRTALLAQFSARPWALDGELVQRELEGYVASPSFDAVLDDLAGGPRQQGAPAGTVPGRLTVGWGRRDRVTLARQAPRAAAAFPDAELHWFDRSGHFPQWDEPAATTALILDRTAR
jgi:pimeloyl-ACP methyl ester carboxylesterase